MKELAQLQKEKNDWRCNSWLESATGRSTVLAAQPGKISCLCLPTCQPACLFPILALSRRRRSGELVHGQVPGHVTFTITTQA